MACKKLKTLFIHSGTHDLSNDMNSIKKLKKKMVQSINELDFSEEIQIIFSGIIDPKYSNFTSKIEKCNTILQSYCKSKGFVFTNNSQLDS